MTMPAADRIFFAGSVIVVVLTLIAAMSVIRTPGTMREVRIDAHRVRDLDKLTSALNCYWTLEAQKALPSNIEALVARIEKETRARVLPGLCQVGSTKDPESAQPYSYRIVGDGEFELCAKFFTASDSKLDPRSYYPTSSRRNWRHQAGDHCFRLKAEEIRLPGSKKTQ